MRTVEAKSTIEKEAAEIERAHDSLLQERMEKEREWLEELKRRAKYSVTNREETQPSRVVPTHCRRDITVCLPEGLGTGHAIRVRGAHKNGNILDGRQGTGEM